MELGRSLSNKSNKDGKSPVQKKNEVFITKLTLQNFRNFEAATFSFGPGLNSIWGENGTGKSNVLEAIYFAATGRPKRAGRDAELIRFGQETARVEARVNRRHSELILEATLESMEHASAKKTLKVNHQPIRKLSELLGQVKVVLFTPADEATVQGEPSFRRRFLDLALSQISSRYLHDLQQYQTVREQRNSLLKRPHSKSELLPWNIELIEFGSQILFKRSQILPRLSEAAGEIHRDLSDGTLLTLSYQSSFPLPPENSLPEIKASFEKALHETALEESERGATLVGPHRDDLRIFLEGVDARLFGSQGEQKTAALSLKLAEGKLFAEAAEGEFPLYLLDDCFSELDPRRQEEVIRMLEPHSQSILTFASFPPAFLEGNPAVELKPMRERRIGERRKEPVSSL